MAEHNPIFTEAARTAVVLSKEEQIRLQCEAREDYYRRTGWKDDYIAEQDQKIERQGREIEQLTSEIHRLRQLLENSGISDRRK